MADKLWIGTDGDWEAAGNWSPANQPVNADDVFILDGDDDIDGLDKSAIDLASMSVGHGFTGSIGTSGTPLQINATTLIYNGRGASAYLSGTYTSAIAGGGMGGDDALHIGGAITSMYVVSGWMGTITFEKVDAGDGATMLTLYICDAPRCTFVAASDVTGPATSAKIDSGNVTLAATCATVEARGGQLTCTGTASYGTTAMNISSGARIRYNSSGAIGVLNLYDATLDFSDNETVGVTITAGNIYSPKGRILEASGACPVTYTSLKQWPAGRCVRVGAGRTIAIT